MKIDFSQIILAVDGKPFKIQLIENEKVVEKEWTLGQAISNMLLDPRRDPAHFDTFKGMSLAEKVNAG